jgi:hypothetical protein
MGHNSYSLREADLDEPHMGQIVALADQPLKALDEARTFLSDHETCEVIEIWREDRLVATVGRLFL